MTELTKAGLSAPPEIDTEDLYRVLSPNTTKTDRQLALMRLVSSSWQRGWADCYGEITERLARYDMAHLVEGLEERQH